jgi:hypothetical protein
MNERIRLSRQEFEEKIADLNLLLDDVTSFTFVGKPDSEDVSRCQAATEVVEKEITELHTKMQNLISATVTCLNNVKKEFEKV